MLDSIPDRPILLPENICQLVDVLSTITISQELAGGFFLQVHRPKIFIVHISIVCYQTHQSYPNSIPCTVCYRWEHITHFRLASIIHLC